MNAWTKAVSGAASREAGGDEAAPRAETMKLARRVDWRFLLPDPSLGRVAYAGPRDGLLAEALRCFSQEFVPLRPHVGSPVPEAGVGDCDLAVVASRRIQDLRDGIEHIRPGGHLYWEVSRLPRFLRNGRRDRGEGAGGPRAGGLLRDPRRVLQELGLEEIRAHCELPNVRSPTLILSLDPAAMRYVTEIRGKRLFGIERCLGLAARMDALPRILPWLGLVARRPGGEEPRQGVAGAAFLGPRLSGWELDRVPWVMLAPRLSWFLITIPLVPGSGRPLAVVKAIRVPGDAKAQEAMERERRGLQFAEKAPLPDPSSVPSLMACGKQAGVRSVAQSAASGRVLSRREVRRRPDEWTRRVVEWLTGLHQTTRRRRAGDSRRLERLVARPLMELQPHLPTTGPRATLVRRTLGITRSLACMDFPFVLEHGDLWSSNILVGRTGRISVVDWEWAEPHGLPGTDLFFFLAFVAMARERALTPEARLEAFRRAFRGPGGWARPWIADYWRDLELPAEAAGPLFVACWSRHVRRLVLRPDGILTDRSERSLRRALWRHHYFQFWREIVTPSGSLEEPYAHLSHAENHDDQHRPG